MVTFLDRRHKFYPLIDALLEAKQLESMEVNAYLIEMSTTIFLELNVPNWCH
jgi:hypothetical protein